MERSVLVIGAGQAGLAAAYHLARAGADYSIADANRRVGDSWRARYDALTLFTPRQFSALPGLELSGNREGYSDRDEFADYLEAYASRLKLPVETGMRVVRLSRLDDGRFEATFEDGGKRQASEIIVAAGAFQVPRIPTVAGKFGSDVLHLTTDIFRNANQLPDGPVLIVGDGASGRDIAVECRRTQPVILATGKPRKLLPERILGKSIWWWLHLTGALTASPDSWLGRRVRATDAFPDRDRSLESLKRKDIRIAPRLVNADETTARFSDGSSAEVRTVVWTVGYRDDSSWLDVPLAVNEDGSFRHEAGVSPVKGLYFVGRPWQRNRASALIMGAGPDAELVVQRLLADRGG